MIEGRDQASNRIRLSAVDGAGEDDRRVPRQIGFAVARLIGQLLVRRGKNFDREGAVADRHELVPDELTVCLAYHEDEIGPAGDVSLQRPRDAATPGDDICIDVGEVDDERLGRETGGDAAREEEVLLRVHRDQPAAFRLPEPPGAVEARTHSYRHVSDCPQRQVQP